MRKLLAYIPIVAVVSGCAVFVLQLLIAVVSDMSQMDLIINAGLIIFSCWLAWGLAEINREKTP